MIKVINWITIAVMIHFFKITICEKTAEKTSECDAYNPKDWGIYIDHSMNEDCNWAINKADYSSGLVLLQLIHIENYGSRWNKFTLPDGNILGWDQDTSVLKDKEHIWCSWYTNKNKTCILTQEQEDICSENSKSESWPPTTKKDGSFNLIMLATFHTCYQHTTTSSLTTTATEEETQSSSIVTETTTTNGNTPTITFSHNNTSTEKMPNLTDPNTNKTVTNSNTEQPQTVISTKAKTTTDFSTKVIQNADDNRIVIITLSLLLGLSVLVVIMLLFKMWHMTRHTNSHADSKKEKIYMKPNLEESNIYSVATENPTESEAKTDIHSIKERRESVVNVLYGQYEPEES